MIERGETDNGKYFVGLLRAAVFHFAKLDILTSSYNAVSSFDGKTQRPGRTRTVNLV